jgi:2-methylcitrate dehydratase PrpD
MTILEQFARTLTASDPALQARIDSMIPAILLDITGAWIAGRATSEGRALDAEQLGPLGAGLLDRVARAVATTRLTETDDIHLASCTTAGAIIVPTALLLAPALRTPPDRVRRAIAAGYDAMIRFGEAVRGPEILYRGLWPTYLAAPLGAAAVVAVLADLDARSTADALAIALAQVSGAPGRGGSGQNPRWLLAGLAARNGCVAALAALRGFGGDCQLLDDDWLSRTHGIALDAAPLVAARPAAALGEISRKPVCAARQTIAAIEAFTRILAEGVDPQEIARVRVHVPGVYRAMIAQAPTGRQSRIASVAYQLALVAYRPDDLLDIERPERDDPRLAAFLPRVEVLADPALDPLYPRRWPARVEIELADGTQRAVQIETAHGDPDRPLTEADLRTKFLRLAGPVIGDTTANELAALCWSAGENSDVIGRLSALIDGGSAA